MIVPSPFYEAFARIRRCEEEIADRYPQGKMRCPTHLSIGQEGVAVGVCAGLKPQDRVFASHRNHHWYLAKGGSMSAMIAELYGLPGGCCGGRGGSMHIADKEAGIWSFPIVGDCISIAVGSALAAKMSGEDRIAVAAFGDAGPETGQFWEALNFASLHKLPVLFVCEDNGYATQTPLSQRQPAVSLAERAEGFLQRLEFPSDHPAPITKATQLLRNALPRLFVVPTYRFRTHVGPEYDWDWGYRSKVEVEYRKSQDPLIALRRELGSGLCAEADARIGLEVGEAFAAAEAA